MEKLIGYTMSDDLKEYIDDGFIRVYFSPRDSFTHKVSFYESDIFNGIVSKESLLDEFKNGFPILVTNFTEEDK